jgi:hypothetical protein
MQSEEFIKNAAELKQRNNERFTVSSGTSMNRLDDFFFLIKLNRAIYSLYS